MGTLCLSVVVPLSAQEQFLLHPTVTPAQAGKLLENIFKKKYYLLTNFSKALEWYWVLTTY